MNSKNNDEIDGLNPLLSLFKTEEDFLIHFFSNVKFFRPELVEIQAKELLEKIKIKNEDSVSIPVRYSMKSKKFFYFKNETTNSGISKKSFKNKAEAQSFNLNQELFHKGTDIKVCIDKDGNYYVRKEIFTTIDYKVSSGLISDIKNYMICHVWGETANPLFFTSLWNLTLIPHYLSFITDKPDENSEIVGKVKNILKAICIELYNPINLLKILKEDFESKDILTIKDNRNADDRKYVEEIFLLARKFINNEIVHFIDKKSSVNLPEITFIENILIPEESLDNKTFIISQLDKLADTEDESLIEILTSKAECKNKFDLAFSIIKEYDVNAEKSIFLDDAGKQRYYKKDTFFENNQKKYIICNHWFPKQRELFELWVNENVTIN